MREKQSSKENWYDQCANLIAKYRNKTESDINEHFEVLNQICKILSKNGFLDDDWWCENERYQAHDK